MTADLAERVSAAKAGDRSAFDDLVRATYADAYTLAYRLVGNEEDARDVVQEAYLRAYKSLKKFREDAAFSTWLYRIVANCASTASSKRNRVRVTKCSRKTPSSKRPASKRIPSPTTKRSPSATA